MRPVEIAASVGSRPARVVGSGPAHTTVTLDDAIVTLWGPLQARRQLVAEIGRELGLVVEEAPGVQIYVETRAVNHEDFAAGLSQGLAARRGGGRS
jgi:hypothetical protein